MKDAADHLARVSLELGGKSPNIVFDDADLEATNNGVVSGIFAATGQTCIAGSRLFVQERAHDQLVSGSRRSADHQDRRPAGDGDRDGPVAFEEQLAQDAGLHRDWQGRGRRAGLRRKEPADPNCGTATSSSRPFLRGSTTTCGWRGRRSSAPFSRSYPSRAKTNLIRQANDTRYGLAAGIWTRDIQKRAPHGACPAGPGTIWVNSYRTLSFNTPLAGTR